MLKHRMSFFFFICEKNFLSVSSVYDLKLKVDRISSLYVSTLKTSFPVLSLQPETSMLTLKFISRSTQSMLYYSLLQKAQNRRKTLNTKQLQNLTVMQTNSNTNQYYCNENTVILKRSTFYI